MDRRLLTWFAFGLVAGSLAAAEDAPTGDFARLVKPLLQKHCVECHGPTEQQSRLRFDQLGEYQPADRQLWTAIHEQLRTGAMPPAGEDRPPENELKQVTAWIEAKQRAEPVGTTRRLNRREFAAALCDVTGLSVDFAYSLPGDGKVDGFDTGAEGLQDAADSVAQAMQVTRRAVAGLRFLEPSTSKVYAADLREAKDVRKVFDGWKADGISGGGEVTPQPGLGWIIRPKWLGDRGGMNIRLPAPERRDGILRLRLVVSVKKPVAGLPNPILWVEVGNRDLGYPEIDGTSDAPHTLDFQVQLSDVAIDAKGLSINLTNRVETPYSVAGYENEDKIKPEEKEKYPGGSGLFRPLFDAKTVPLDQQPTPLIVVHSFEIETDYRAAWPPEKWSADVGKLEDDRASAQKVIALFMERAWRRPVAAAEQDRFLALFDKLQRDGCSFDEALRPALQAVLLSGSFRYLQSPAVKAGTSLSDSQYAIASRLSFMLWGAPPDAELLKLASAGKLRDPAMLDAQVDRLLADSRSDGFFRPFVTQWLEMGQPITVAMTNLQQQDYRFGRNLKASMQEETIAYFRQLVAENRPAREILAGEWTMMNDILARHYGYEGIEGGRLRKVALRPDDPRGGGILAHAGIQSMLCWMGDNWVIYRGSWTLRRLLDDPPPAPPLEVPELVPADAKNHGKTFKQLLAQHQEDTRCSVCHRKMDPLGFAFQNFDLSGRWREREFDKYVKNDLDGKIEWRGEGKDRPVDAAGKLPRGEPFAGFRECQELLVKHYTDDLVRGLTKFLVLYGAGHACDVDDLATLRSITAEQKAREYPLRDLLKAILKSPAFLDK